MAGSGSYSAQEMVVALRPLIEITITHSKYSFEGAAWHAGEAELRGYAVPSGAWDRERILLQQTVGGECLFELRAITFRQFGQR